MIHLECNRGSWKGRSLFAGLEVSTSRVRVLFADEQGTTCYSAYSLHDRGEGALGTAVQNPRRWLDAFASLLSHAARDGVPLSQVEAIGVCATTPTLVFLDAAAKPLLDEALLWCDPNLAGHANPFGTNIALRKIASVIHRHPDIFANAQHIVDAGGYLKLALTGNICNDLPGYVQKFGMTPDQNIDLRGLEQIDARLLSQMCDKIRHPVIFMGQPAGKMLQNLAQPWSLPGGIPVVSGGFDSVAAMVGGVAAAPNGTLLVSVGTSVAFYVCLPANVGELGVWPRRRGLLPGDYVVTGGGFEAGTQSIDLIHKDLRLTYAASRDENLERMAADGEVFFDEETIALPFGGVPLRAPLPQISLPTIIACNSISPSLNQMLVAMRRGIAAYIRYAVESLQSRSVVIDRIHVVGGGTRSPSFCQLVADAVNLPVRRFDNQAAASGAALLALRHVRSLAGRGETDLVHEDRLRAEARPLHEPSPSPSRRALYDGVYRRFCNRLSAELSASR